MKNSACVELLARILPPLGRDADGYKKVAGGVCNRVDRRIRSLKLAGVEAYLAWIDSHPEEWAVLDRLTQVTVSRFFREKGVFAYLARKVVPALVERAVAEKRPVRVASLGCAAGEEPYGVADLFRVAGAECAIVAVDNDEKMIERAAVAVYRESGLKEVNPAERARLFDPAGEGTWRLREGAKGGVSFARADIRKELPPGPFDLILCRYLVFTYDADAGRRSFVDRLAPIVAPGGWLVVGKKERLPEPSAGWELAAKKMGVYRKVEEA
jgi:chemotaxis protein methyltransferase CheR